MKETFVFYEDEVSRLMDHIRENYYTPSYRMVHDILQYVSAQGLDDDETLDILCALLGSLGIKKDEIEDILIQEGPILDDNAVFRLGDYIQENFNSPGYLMVADILQYVAAQELDEEETLDILCVLLDSLGIKRDEIKDVLKISREEV